MTGALRDYHSQEDCQLGVTCKTIEPPEGQVYMMNLDSILMSCGICGREFTGHELIGDEFKVSLDGWGAGK